MPKITFLPSGAAAQVPAGTNVADAARLAGVMIDLPCGGKGTCGKCLVRVAEGSLESKQAAILTGEQKAEGFVHACMSSVAGDAVIVVPDNALEKDAYADDRIDLFEGAVPAAAAGLSPVSRKICVDVQKPGREDGLSDLDRLNRSLDPFLNGKGARYPLSVLRKLSEALRGDDGRITVTTADDGDALCIVDVKSGHDKGRTLGVAVDLGTTTISVQLIDLEDANTLSTRNGYNEQIHCGLDVISRINYASARERLEDLRARAVHSINRLIREALDDACVSREDATCCHISGNTVMTHLLLGLNPEYIRLEPYTPTVLQAPPFAAGELGIEIHPEAPVFLSPCVGSYVGGDITAGILVTDLAKGKEEISLFIDIGTNGEIVLGNADFLMTCACSAGPAFEGGGIDCGMRATTGAIDRATIDRETGKARYTVIGGGKASGICGSGLIDLIAGLFLTGWIDSSGRFDRERPSPFIRADGRRATYTIVGADASGTGRPVILGETDVENFMRAKAAIYSAAALMLKEAGLGFVDLSVFYVAGGFGRFLDIENAIAIGLLPDIAPDKFNYVGNASLSGTRLCLLSEEFGRTRKALSGRMTYIDLSNYAGYMDQYMAALFLPHTDIRRFPSVEKILRASGT